VAWLLLGLVLARPASGQVWVDAGTEVRDIRFEGVRALPETRLHERLQTRQRASAYGFRVALGKLPFIPDPARHAFSPLELQRDVVRLRDAYAAAGFFTTQVRYEVRRDDEKNLLDITFVVDEGRPLVLTEVTVTGPDSLSAFAVPEGEQKSWERLEGSVRKQQGRRLILDDARKAQEDLSRWWRSRGYPRASVSTRFRSDTARFEGYLAYRVHPGSSARFGEVRVEGNRTMSAAAIRRRIPVHTGDPYSALAVEKAQLNLQELDIVRSVDVVTPTLAASDASAAARDSTAAAVVDSVVPVRIRILEADRRLVSGDLGYVTDGGLSSEARWINRNITGAAGTLTVTGLAQTGWLALTDDPDVRYRLAVALKLPAAFEPRLSTVLTPFIEHRDDTQDRSTKYGISTTLVYRLRQFESVSLDYQIARRNVYEYHFGDLTSGDIDLLTFLTQVSQGMLDSLGSTLRYSTFTLAGTVGRLDDPANPRRGVIVRPAIQVTAPNSMSSTAYWRLDAAANGFLPLGRFAVLASRVSLGRLFPFGKSIPGPDDNVQTMFLQLRDVTFTAGGTGDVRGWENRMVGPKVPDVRFETVGDSIEAHADGYVPLGGFARASFSVELQLPLRVLGPNLGTHVFLDGGRVWTDDARFGMQGDPQGQERLFFATGAGFDLRTPVGPIKIGVGYKLNPSITDLAASSELLRAAAEGRPFDEVHRKNSRRWQWHLAIGASY